MNEYFGTIFVLFFSFTNDSQISLCIRCVSILLNLNKRWTVTKNTRTRARTQHTIYSTNLVLVFIAQSFPGRYSQKLYNKFECIDTSSKLVEGNQEEWDAVISRAKTNQKCNRHTCEIIIAFMTKLPRIDIDSSTLYVHGAFQNLLHFSSTSY